MRFAEMMVGWDYSLWLSRWCFFSRSRSSPVLMKKFNLPERCPPWAFRFNYLITRLLPLLIGCIATCHFFKEFCRVKKRDLTASSYSPSLPISLLGKENSVKWSKYTIRLYPSGLKATHYIYLHLLGTFFFYLFAEIHAAHSTGGVHV